MSTLLDFRYKRKYEAGNGADGQGARKTGKDGTRRIINRRRKKNGHGSAACNTQAQYPGSGW